MSTSGNYLILTPLTIQKNEHPELNIPNLLKMKRLLQFTILAPCSVLLLFSCGGKSGIDTETAPTNSKVSVPAPDKINPVTSWIIDTNASQVKFEIQNLGMTVKGTLGGLKGTILFDPKDLKNSRFETAVEVGTMKTGISKRDEDLMRANYLAQKQFAQIVFRSDSMTRIDNGYEVYGTLTLKGKSQHRSLLFTFHEEGKSGTFKSHFTVNRLDFGIGSKTSIMGDEAQLTLEVITTKKQS
jgi:polyisoprenoid-binding protein YceI